MSPPTSHTVSPEAALADSPRLSLSVSLTGQRLRWPRLVRPTEGSRARAILHGCPASLSLRTALGASHRRASLLSLCPMVGGPTIGAPPCFLCASSGRVLRVCVRSRSCALGLSMCVRSCRLVDFGTRAGRRPAVRQAGRLSILRTRPPPTSPFPLSSSRPHSIRRAPTGEPPEEGASARCHVRRRCSSSARMRARWARARTRVREGVRCVCVCNGRAQRVARTPSLASVCLRAACPVPQSPSLGLRLRR